jgi:hypothetical protein
MIRRIAVVTVAILALTGGTAAVAKKKPKIKTGTYIGTTSNGISMSVTLDVGRKSGSVSYCGMFAPFTVSGKSFAVTYQDPVSFDTIVASGLFNAKKKTVSGSIGPNGCDSTAQTFTLQR